MLRIGQTIAGYRIDGVLGSGGMSVVYRATQLSLGRTVALKVLAPHLSLDADFRARFRREAMLQAQLEHPHIVTVYEAGVSDEGLYLALRLVEGTDLKRLATEGVTASRALRLLEQAASALDVAHEAGLVHRDVKPQNILVDEQDRAYLADFGLTKGAGSRGLTLTGHYVGSLDYVAPEQVRGEPTTAASDLYAFAAVLYETLAGVVPFPHETEAALLYAHVSEPPPRLSERKPELPPALDEVIAVGLAKDPEARYGSATALVRAAQAALQRTAVAIAEPLEPDTGDDGPSPAPRAFGETIVDPSLLRRAPVLELDAERRIPGKLIAAGVAALLLALAFAGFALGRTYDRPGQPPLGLAIAGPAQLSFPLHDWRPVRVPALRGLRLAAPVALAERRARGATIVAGLAPVVAPRSFLPRELAAGNAGGRPGEPVRLGSYDALRYGRASLRSGMLTVLYVVPAGRGAAAVVCSAPEKRPAPGALDRCESVATTIVLRGVRPGLLGPDPRYAKQLRSLIARLATTRRSERRAMQRARTPEERAGHAQVVASAFATAAAQAGGLAAGVRERPAQAQFVRALGAARDAYVGLASSLQAREPRAYAIAAQRVSRSERAADNAVRKLASLGYGVPR